MCLNRYTGADRQDVPCLSRFSLRRPLSVIVEPVEKVKVKNLQEKPTSVFGVIATISCRETILVPPILDSLQ